MVSVAPGVEAVNEPVFLSGEEAAMFEVDVDFSPNRWPRRCAVRMLLYFVLLANIQVTSMLIASAPFTSSHKPNKPQVTDEVL
ncbi:hypothetical protein V8C44DRAFT_323177 [Trichoderma aethiopicum]